MSVFGAIVFWAFTLMGGFFLFGTGLSLTRGRHWFVRGWDFPRVLLGSGLALSALVHVALSAGAWYNLLFAAALLAAAVWQVYKIVPYTPLAPVTVEAAARAPAEATIRFVASNVLMENDEHERWLEVIRKADPDVILVLEMDERWLAEIRVLEEDYPHTVLQPQDNYYGMGLFSRLPLSGTKVRFVVEDDVPSIHTRIRLDGGAEISFHGIHPRPPEPILGVHSTQRDAELVVTGREIRDQRQEERCPTIIAGDFNDVAWSRTTLLFLKLSELLDPRKGRGLFNSFDANRRWFRFPLDHVFHSSEFSLVEIKLLEHVGSDHFPVLIELCYEPGLEKRQPTERADADDEEEADERISGARKEGFRVDEDPI